MKLPTLNIDLSVNTASFTKKLRMASDDLAKFGNKAAKIGGASLPGPLGALSKVGGLTGGIANAASFLAGGVQAPFKISDAIISTFNDAVSEATKTMELFAKGGDFGATGLNPALAARLVAAGEQQNLGGNIATNKGWLSSAIAAATDETGDIGGVLGFLKDWADSIQENGKWLVAASAAVLAGKGGDDVLASAEMAVAPSLGAAQSYQTASEINRFGKTHEKMLKQQREQNT